MSGPSEHAIDGSVSGSEEEALSQECVLEDFSQGSLSSGDTGRVPTPIDSIPVTLVDPIPSSLVNFLHVAQHEPLCTAIKDFRVQWKKSHSVRLETPSAFAAANKADQMRQEFTNLVLNTGSLEQQREWTTLSPDICDMFLCHLFLPPDLGGIFPAE